MQNVSIDLDTVRSLRTRYAAALADENDYVDGLMRDARVNHTSLPDNYWQAAHRLRGLLETTDTIIDVLATADG